MKELVLEIIAYVSVGCSTIVLGLMAYDRIKAFVTRDKVAIKKAKEEKEKRELSNRIADLQKEIASLDAKRLGKK